MLPSVDNVVISRISSVKVQNTL